MPWTTAPSMSVSGRTGCLFEPDPPSMWSTEDMIAGSGISSTTRPGIGSALSFTM